MKVSLRLRLLLVTAATTGAALVGVGLFSRRLTIAQMERYNPSPAIPRTDLAAVVARLEEHYAARGEWDETILREASGGSRGFLLLSKEGKIESAWPPELRTATITIGDDGSRLHLELKSGGRDQELSVAGAPHVAITGQGRVLATLYVLPPPAPAEAGEVDVRSSVTRPLALAVVFALAAALAATLLLSRYILRPVAMLTWAAGRIAEGDLLCRVPVGARDEIGSLSLSFNTMVSKLARNEELRLNMVNDISHELRTPLTRIRCQVESIEDGLAEPTPLAIAQLREQVGELQQLIDDLQDLALGDAGQLRLNLAPVSLEKVIRAAAAAAGGQVRIEIASPLPDVMADERRVRQILSNLLGNALRYTPAGSLVTVAAKAAGPMVETRVSDSGPGIAAHHLSVVFERFYRLDDARIKAAGGCGLGLAIVRNLVEAHGGTVYAMSPAGEGATFVFTLPSVLTTS